MILQFYGKDVVVKETAQAIVRAVRDEGREPLEVYLQFIRELVAWARDVREENVAIRVVLHVYLVSNFLRESDETREIVPSPDELGLIMVEGAAAIDKNLGREIQNYLQDVESSHQEQDEEQRMIAAAREGAAITLTRKDIEGFWGGYMRFVGEALDAISRVFKGQ